MKQTRLLSLFLALCLLFSLFVSCGKPDTPAEDTPQENPVTETTITYELTVRNNNLHSSEQQAFLNGKYNELLDSMDGKAEQSHPQAIVLKWSQKVDGEYKKPIS